MLSNGFVPKFKLNVSAFTRGAMSVVLAAFSFAVSEAGTLTVSAEVTAPNPEILAYNLGHFVDESNAHDWWRYSGVNGARIFINPKNIEVEDDIVGHGDGVTDVTSFLARKEALRNEPLSTEYINWSVFEYEYDNRLFGTLTSGNRFVVSYALRRLRELDISILVQATSSESRLPIVDSEDWAGKWELWQHYYAQAFHLGREFDVFRYQMFNEPNHSNANGLTPENWLMRLQLVTDAVTSALEDINEMYGKSLEPLIYAPVNSGGSDSYRNRGWGELAVEKRHENFLGETDPDYWVMHRYDFHEYNSTPQEFGDNLLSLHEALDEDMVGETRFPTVVTEFNVHTNSNFDDRTSTLDYPTKYSRLGAISAQLAKNGISEMYCFKFGQSGTSGDNYPIKKNGMHYVHNAKAPFEYGGATMSAEVWRLFVKALKPGGEQLVFEQDSSLTPLDVRVTYSSDKQCYYVFSANFSDDPVDLSIDTTAWGLEAGVPFLLEEVGSEFFGSGREWGAVPNDGILVNRNGDVFTQEENSVLLFTISTADLENEETFVVSEDASVVDGEFSGQNFDGETSLYARNDPESRDERKAAFLKFRLPVIYPGDIQMAVLSTNVRTGSTDTVIQSHVYGLDEDNWDSEQMTWSNAPQLKKDIPAGNTIVDRFIAGQGDQLHIYGQITASGSEFEERLIDVTEYLRGQSGRNASFLISQDPRWDVALPSLVEGDTQEGGLEFAASESGSGALLKLFRLKDSDKDGISDQAESSIFLTDPNLADTDEDGLSDGEEWYAGSDPLDSTSGFVIPIVEVLDEHYIQISWSTLEGRQYTVLRSDTLDSDQWEELVTVSGTGEIAYIVDQDIYDRSEVFYRIRLD